MINREFYCLQPCVNCVFGIIKYNCHLALPVLIMLVVIKY